MARDSGRPAFGRGFWRLWCATTASGLGDGIRITAIAVFATVLTADPLQVALVTVAGQLPWALVGPFAGALVDRVDRWRALWLCDAVRAVVVAAFVALVRLGGVGVALLAVTAFVLSSVETMAENLSQAVVPDVAGDGSLDSANSKLLGGQFVTTEFLGAPLGTALFVLARPLPFLIDAVSFVVSAVLITSVRTRRPTAAPANPPMTPRALLSETVAGVRWLWRNTLLRTLCLVVGLLNFAVLAVLGIAVLYAVRVLDVSRAAYGLLLLIIAVGGLVGLLVAPKLVAVLGRGRTIQLPLALCPLSFLVGGFTSDPIVAAVAFMVVGASISLANVVTTTVRQALIPAELFGRVNGAYRFVVNGMSPLGGLVGGLVAGGLGLRAPFFLAAAVFVVAIALTLPLLSNKVVDPLVAAYEADRSAEPAGGSAEPSGAQR